MANQVPILEHAAACDRNDGYDQKEDSSDRSPNDRSQPVEMTLKTFVLLFIYIYSSALG